MDVTDPLEVLRRTLIRRSRVVWLIPLVSILVLWSVMTWVAPPAPSDLPLYFANLAFLLGPVAVLVLVARFGMGRTAHSLEPLRPRIREVGVPGLRGVIVVTDNGLALQVAAGMVYCQLFLRSDDSVLHPNLSDVVRWTRPFRTKRLWRLRDAGGGPAIDPLLADLRLRFAASHALVFIGEYKDARLEPRAPQWIVLVCFTRPFQPPKIVAIAGALDAIVDLCNRSLQEFRARGLALHPVGRR